METDHIKMICDIGELNNLFSESGTIEAFLQRIVELVADHMKAEVCSIYLYEEATDELVLTSTTGLNPESINKVRMKLGEGLMGHALNEMRAVCEMTGSDHPNFKFYPETGEELYNCYLAIPIIRGKTRIGVLAVQRGGDNYFAERDVMALRATTSQLAPMIENVKLLISRNEELPKQSGESSAENLAFIKGKPSSSGYAYEKAAVMQRDSLTAFAAGRNIEKRYSPDDFENALKKTEQYLEELQQKVEETLSDAASLIFASHLLILKDNGFTGTMRTMIAQGANPPEAILDVYEKYRDIFEKSENPLIREKVQDIEDLSRRIIDNLLSDIPEETSYKGKIIVSRDLFPSDLLKLSVQGINGAVLTSGGVTSHVSILARSLRIPMVIVDAPGLLAIGDDTMILLDADQGNVYINPGEDIVKRFREQEEAKQKLLVNRSLLLEPARTMDGIPVSLKLNVNLLSDIRDDVLDLIDGVGLYRTEFPFLIRNGFPSEEEQYIIYRKLVERMKGKPATIRTLDIGGDKVLSYYQFEKEENPFLGMRSIRFSLLHEDIFEQQIRAILRAGAEKKIKIMFPMISSIDEFNKAKGIVQRCMRQLNAAGVPHCETPAIGIMVEIPSIVNLIEDIATNADFFSVGTNDLIQYTIAVDRTNDRVADLYVPHHPAILRSLKRVADAALNAGIPATICGDMANQERYIPFLLGAGFHELSVDAIYLPRIKKAIREISMKEAIKKAESMLSENTVEAVTRLL